MQGAVLLAVGDLLSLSSNLWAYAPPISDRAATQTTVGGTNAKHVFKVDGWDRLCDSVGDEIFIRVNQAWRTPWR